MTEVFTLRLSELRGREDALLAAAGSRRRERAQRFRRADDRLRCLAAGCLMRRYVPGYTEERLRTGPDGKPFLPGGVPFSVSHGGDYIVLARCGGALGVGVDVEPIREMAYYRAILPRVMTEEERRAIGEDAGAFVRLWTRKESLYKTVGEGVSDLSELPPVLEDRTALLGAPCRLCTWQTDGHVFSLALRGVEQAEEPSIKPAELI